MVYLTWNNYFHYTWNCHNLQRLLGGTASSILDQFVYMDIYDDIELG
jgi:hypothetical protein